MSAPEVLATAVRELALARDLTTLTAIVRREARRVSGADGVTFVLRDGAFALTGWGLPADKARAAAAGFDHHVTKPADPRMLGALIGLAERAQASG